MSSSAALRIQAPSHQPSGAAERISRLAASFLAKRGPPVAIRPGQDLRDAGLTSLDLMNLILAVESEFDLFIPEPKMTAANLRSVASIEALVSSLA